MPLPAARSRLTVLLALVAVLVPLLAPAPAPALRVAAYNLLNYSSGREAEYRMVLEALQPDVIVVEEILSQAAVNRFRDLVLDQVDPGAWEAATFVDGPDTDNAFFWRSAAVDTAGHFVIPTALRDIDEWTFRPASHASPAANVRIYVVHLKASQGSDNEAKRLAEVQAMRARMETFPAGGNVLVAGDFNIYTSTESAYQYMTNPVNGLSGVVQDPIAREGNWHVNPAFADIHTQSPRTVAFGGGATGGMDDRFDLMLVGPATQDGESFDVLDSTYAAFGQDGLHYDGALNVAPFGVAVDSTVQLALYYASDHLPVVADFQVPALLVADAALDLGDAIVGFPAEAFLSVSNGAPPPADELDYSFAAPAGFSAPAGSFTANVGDPVALHAIGLDTSSPAALSGDLVVTTDDPDRPTQAIPLTGRVVDHAVPSFAPAVVALADTLDLGTVVAGDTASAPFAVHNAGWVPLQADLEVHDAAIGGDPRFALEGGFVPAVVGGTPASWTVAFDAVGAAEGPYAATLVLSTRDRSDILGGSDLDDLVLDLVVQVQAGAVAAGDPFRPDRTGFVAIAPNPSSGPAELRFALVRPAGVRLAVYDVRGRRVVDLADGREPAGIHRRTWDGRDASGRALAPGIYFARLEADGVVETRKLVRLR